MKSQYVQYYVEGDDEEKLINVLKSKMRLIRAGKVQKLNAVEQRINDVRLRTLTRGTMVVLVFDTDTGERAMLDENIRKLKACSAVSEVVLIPQVPNLEGELLRSCKIRNITELLNSKSVHDFKKDLKRISNLDAKLSESGFDIKRFWNTNPGAPYEDILTDADKIKLNT